MRKIQSINEVVAWRLCIGCGACAYICPEKITLFDFPAEGIRPVEKRDADCTACNECLTVCPGIESNFVPVPAVREENKKKTVLSDFEKEWGPVLDLWEGHATDDELRFRGSSGGIITALSAYCLEVLGMKGVLHIGQDPEAPIKNRTRLSQNREELLAAIGSRYSPASVCDGLALVEEAGGPCVVIGKPGEVTAVDKARRMRPRLDGNVGLVLSFFCAETPSTAGTEALLSELGVKPDTVMDLKYRGNGWPGHFTPMVGDNPQPAPSRPYRESWRFLEKFRPWAAQMWPDGGGELADISLGDPWHTLPDGKNPGLSLVAVRTERGRRILQGAIEAGYISLKPLDLDKLPKSQGYLLKKKGSIYGRRAAMRLFRLPVPSLKGANLRHCWNQLSTKDKLREAFGTARRVLKRNLRKPLRLNPASARRVGLPVTASRLQANPADAAATSLAPALSCHD